MKYVLMLALVVLLAAGAACGGYKAPTAPSGDGSQTFTAMLHPAEEMPPVTGAEAAGHGTATITLNAVKDANGNVTSATATFAVNLSGFPTGTPINMAHIHRAAAGQSGDVVVNTTLLPGEVTLQDGTGSFTKNNVAVTPDLANQLMNNPGGFYFNVHSTLNPGGVARGQLVRAQ
jgi:CHRD domain